MIITFFINRNHPSFIIGLGNMRANYFRRIVSASPNYASLHSPHSLSSINLSGSSNAIHRTAKNCRIHIEYHECNNYNYYVCHPYSRMP